MIHYNHLSNSRSTWNEQAPQVPLYQLLPMLTDLGVTGLPDVAELDRVERLIAVYPFDRLGSLRAASDDELRAAIIETSALADSHGAPGAASQRIRLELLRDVAARADDYIDQLQTIWEPSIAAVRELIAAGVQPTDKAEQILDHEPATQQLWRQVRTEHVPIICKVANARVAMSLAVGIPPVNRRNVLDEPVDYSLALTSPYAAGLLDDRKTRGESDFATVMRVAPSLHLPHVSDLNPSDILKAEDPSYARALERPHPTPATPPAPPKSGKPSFYPMV